MDSWITEGVIPQERTAVVEVEEASTSQPFYFLDMEECQLAGAPVMDKDTVEQEGRIAVHVAWLREYTGDYLAFGGCGGGSCQTFNAKKWCWWNCVLY